MRILVCGGAGYIGSHMSLALAECGHTVEVVDDLSTGHAAAVRWGTLHRGDLGDAAFIGPLLRRIQPDAVMHFAARSLVGESVADPALYYRNNVAATLTLLEAMRATVPRPFVFSSTAAVYGEPQCVPIDENHACAPINPYGVTKHTVERALADYWRAYRLPSVSLRYFNAAGAEAQARIGESHAPETHLIPRVLKSALDGGGPLTVFGDDYPTADGTCIRDYVHVEDLCQAHLLALERLCAQPSHEVFNLGNGRGYSVREVLQATAEVVGRPVAHRVGPRRAGDPAVLVADSGRAREILGWRPRRTDLSAIVDSAWRWHRRPAF
ncbi:MAG: UDP-glucose 4-epimerase GalE [Gammaproteobacteria bacterium]|nr:UDP-glucose 4-epimerase GalE [Gammaproteobacteria bacterium]